jgi:NADH-quinone oxidoreductase subunit C
VSDRPSLADALNKDFPNQLQTVECLDLVTVTLLPNDLVAVMKSLRDDDQYQFEQLTDACGIDYSEYGLSQWRTTEATETGFNRAVPLGPPTQRMLPWDKPRFAVVYHLLSLACNRRLRVKVFLDETMTVPSLVDIWPSVNWYEREAFDLFGILFSGHPDLRRLLTDYGFKGHPFRKDFPLIGEVEMRYDAATGSCIYEPVSITPRILVPKVIRVQQSAPNQSGDGHE